MGRRGLIELKFPFYNLAKTSDCSLCVQARTGSFYIRDENRLLKQSNLLSGHLQENGKWPLNSVSSGKRRDRNVNLFDVLFTVSH